MENNFLPNIKCPYCGKFTVAAISGFGGILNTRKKECRFCHKTFYVDIFVETSVDKDSVEDGRIRDLQSRIRYLKKQRKKNYAELLVTYTIAKKINEEALRTALQMHKKKKLN